MANGQGPVSPVNTEQVFEQLENMVGPGLAKFIDLLVGTRESGGLEMLFDPAFISTPFGKQVARPFIERTGQLVQELLRDPKVLEKLRPTQLLDPPITRARDPLPGFMRIADPTETYGALIRPDIQVQRSSEEGAEELLQAFMQAQNTRQQLPTLALSRKAASDPASLVDTTKHEMGHLFDQLIPKRTLAIFQGNQALDAEVQSVLKLLQTGEIASSPPLKRMHEFVASLFQTPEIRELDSARAVLKDAPQLQEAIDFVENLIKR